MINVNYYFLLFNHTLYVFRRFDINLQTCMCSVYRDTLKKIIIPCLADRYTSVYIHWFYMCPRSSLIFKYYKLYNKIKVDLTFLKANSLHDRPNDRTWNFFHIIGDVLYISTIDACTLNSTQNQDRINTMFPNRQIKKWKQLKTKIS